MQMGYLYQLNQMIHQMNSNNEQTKSSDISDGSNDLDETPSNPNELLNGFRDVDQMENSRFKIEQEGLQMIYNAPPKIDGLENILYLYSGEKLDIQKSYRRYNCER